MATYDEGAHEVDLEDMEARQVPCWLGVDLSKNEDLTVAVACFRDGDFYLVHPWFFCPEDNLRARGERHGIDYVDWPRRGFVTPTAGNVVDLRAVEDCIREACARFDVREIAFDPTFGRSMMTSLRTTDSPRSSSGRAGFP